MASLTGSTIAESYEQLLSLPDGGLNGNNLVAITDGDSSTAIGMKVATNKIEIIPGSDDANAFEVSQADGTAVFTVNTSSPAFTLTGNATITTADNTDTLTLTSTDADANSGSNLKLYRNSGSPAGNDLLGNIQWEGRNNNSQDVVYAEMRAQIETTTDGSEDANFKWSTMKAGTSRDRLSINANSTVFNDDSVDVDFRVESNGNANMLVVDAGNDKVGIGTAAPTAPLHIKGTPVQTSGARAAQLYIEDTTVLGSVQNSGIQFRQIYHDNGSITSTSGIVGLRISTSSGNYGGALIFQTRANGADLADNMIIGADGKVGIGTTSPSQLLTVSSTSADAIMAIDCGHASSNAILIIESAAGRDSKIKFTEADTTKWEIYNDGSDSDILKISDDGDVRVAFDQSGNVTVSDGNLVVGTSGHGIDFTAEAASTASGADRTGSILDDYEEGTYTGAITFASGTISIHPDLNALSYTKIGRMVHVFGTLQCNGIDSPSGASNLNLPFTTADLLDNAGVSFATGVAYLNGSAITNANYRIIFELAEGSASTRVFFAETSGGSENLGDNHIASGSNFYVNITYPAA